MDYRTATDITIHELLKDIAEGLRRNKMWKSEFYMLLGKIHAAKKILDYKSMGCPMGVHASSCLCSHNVVSKCVDNFLLHKKKAA